MNKLSRKKPRRAPSRDLSELLTNLKLIYQHGLAHSKNRSKAHLLFAVHNSHYVVEQVVREIAKNVSFTGPLHKIGFERILEAVNRKRRIPDYNRLVALNKVRNDAEHWDIMPDADTVRFYVRIAGDFLKWSYSRYFDTDYDSLMLEKSIHDAPIRECMMAAKALIEANDLRNASAKLYESLAAFKFLAFGFLSDPRVQGTDFPGIDFPNLLADLGFKIMMGEDESALRFITLIGSSFKVEDGKVVGVQSKYPIPEFKSKEDANEQYAQILDLILSYQDRFPTWVWRMKV